MLKIGDNLSLPREAVTQTFGILAMRGAGKTNAARVMAEEMFAAKLPFVAIDPVGAWWGLRSSGDGKSAGLPIPIFGGKHGDVPLEPNAGELIADLVAEKRLSCVLDVSEFDSEGDKKVFLLAFARRLFKKNEDPLHLFLEEADDYIPQKPMGRDEPFLLRAWENIVKRGRSRGLGMTCISQRSAAINKNVLTQIGTLITMRTTSPQDRKAIEAWVEYHQQSEEILESLSSLEDGEAWVWSPQFLGKVARIHFRLSETYDSGATPKNVAAGARRPIATMADIDLGDLQSRMAATIEKAKAEDPRELKKQIAALQANIRNMSRAASTQGVQPDPEALKRAEEKGYARLRRELARFQPRLLRIAAELEERISRFDGIVPGLRVLAEELEASQAASGTIPENPPVNRHSSFTPMPRQAAPRKAPPPSSDSDGLDVGNSGLRRMLIALAQRNGISAKQVGVRAVISSKSGTFGTYLGRARANGWITGERGKLEITGAGVAALGTYEPLPEGRELLEYWLEELGESGAGRMLRVLAQAWPKAMTAEELGDVADISSTSGTFGTYLGRLRSLELISGSRGDLRASGEFFDDAARA